MTTIRTPDQRLRVFVSSAIQELREERKVVRDAIERMRLIPVLFEDGARPHPAREIYRAYLDQSDIFIGIYGGTYGWVAPDMTVSGLEDEYNLSHGRPQLIYIKQDGKPRDPRLEELLRTIKSNDAVSYQKFTTPEQLAGQLQNDLALLLSERFAAHERNGLPKGPALPVMRNVTIGRDRERAELAELLLRPDVGLVTLTGTGGTGKSHLALRVAHELAPRFADGARFVPLAGVDRPAQVLPAIASALGLVDGGQYPVEQAITEQLAGSELLVVVDNFEHVLDAAPSIATLLSRSPGLTLLVTSRAPLHLSGEQVYPVLPLAEPASDETRTKELLACASVDLFVQRARARAAHLTLDDENVRAIADLCRHLEGLPLAIELAAAHTKYFTPAALAARTDRLLDLLARGPRDLPERQRTMRAAIASSVELLDEPHRIFFRRLAVFNERWTLEMASAITDAPALGVDPMEAVEQLVDMGLVRVATPRPFDPDHEPRFQLLHVMREYAGEELDAHDERTATMQRMLQWGLNLVAQVAQQARTDAVSTCMDLVEVNYLDLRTLIRSAIERGDVPTAWMLIAQLNTFWLLRGYRGEALDWLRGTGIDRLVSERDFAAEVPVILRGGVLLSAGAMCYYAEHLRVGEDYLVRATELFEEAGPSHFLLFYAWLFLGLARIGSGHAEAGAAMDKAMDVAIAMGDGLLKGMALCYRSEVLVRAGEMENAKADLVAAKMIARDLHSSLLLSSIDLTLGNVAIVEGRIEDAARAFDDCIRVGRALRVAGTLGWALNGMGYALVRSGRVEEGRSMFMEGIAVARQSGYQAMLMAQWSGLAWIIALHGDHVRAARVIGAAEAMRVHIQYSSWTATRVILQAAHESAKSGLTPEVFAAEMAAGAALPPEQVHALATQDGSMVY